MLKLKQTCTCVIKLHNVYFQDPHKKQEDVHSDLSNDTGTFDSGMGGSVSDTGTVLCNILLSQFTVLTTLEKRIKHFISQSHGYQYL